MTVIPASSLGSRGTARPDHRTSAPPEMTTRPTTLRFEHRRHMYFDGKRWLPSVTGICGKVEDKGGLLIWHADETAKCAIEEAAELSRLRRLENDDAAFEWLRKAPDRKRDKATVSGSDLHDVADRMLSGQDVPEYLHPDVKTMAEHVLAFMRDFRVTVLHSEVRLAHRTMGYCGTTDNLGIVPQYGDVPVTIDWKGLALDTPIPTPDGWSTMGQLQVGDHVFDRNGQVTTVIGKSPVHLKDCYRVKFRDGTSVVCDADHRWVVETGYSPKTRTEQVLEASDLPANLRNRVTGKRHLRVPLNQPLELPEVELPIDPYVLGCWLGDGTSSSGAICKPDDELFEHIKARGYEVLARHRVARGVGSRTVVGLTGQLRAAGLFNNKHIPPRYLRASSEQRLALLRGLMDTDGTANIARRGECSFTSVDKTFAHDVMELVLSLGYPARINEINGHGFGKDVTSYDVTFRAVDHNPFLLTRKAERVGFIQEAGRHRMIMAVEPTVTVPTQCIEVDSPTSTYLCTEKFIPTHNTSASMYEKPKFSHGKNAMQLAPYSRAEFMFWDDKTEADMIEVNQDVGLIVMIRPEGYKVYDYDLVRAWPQFIRAFDNYHWWRNTDELAHGPVRPKGMALVTAAAEDFAATAAAAESPEELFDAYQRAVAAGAWNDTLKETFSRRKVELSGAVA
jgi:hypothetical protein